MINIEVSPVGSLLPADCSSHCCFAVLLVVLLLLHTVIGFPKSAPNPGHSPGDACVCCCCYGVSWTALTKRSLSSSLTPWQGKLQEAGPVTGQCCECVPWVMVHTVCCFNPTPFHTQACVECFFVDKFLILISFFLLNVKEIFTCNCICLRFLWWFLFLFYFLH